MNWQTLTRFLEQYTIQGFSLQQLPRTITKKQAEKLIKRYKKNFPAIAKWAKEVAKKV